MSYIYIYKLQNVDCMCIRVVHSHRSGFTMFYISIRGKMDLSTANTEWY